MPWGGQWWPWGHWHLGSAPGAVSGAAAPRAVRAGLGEQLQPGQAGSIPAGQLDTHSEPGPVPSPAGPGVAGLCSLEQGGSAVARGCAPGRAVPSGVPRAAPQLPGPAGLRPSPLSQPPRGSFRKLLLPWPQEPPAHHPCAVGLDCAASLGAAPTLWGD